MALYGVASTVTPPSTAGLTALGSAATVDTTALATSAQGAKADTALQNAAAFATAAQGTKADSALQANPNIGAATGTSLAVTGALTSSGAAIGYAAGAGGTVTQATSKSTGVTLSKLCGTITMNGAALAAATIVTFTVTNTLIAATDVIHVQHDTVGTIGAYTVMPNTSAAGSFKISVRNNTAGSLSEAIVLRFAIIKGVVT